MTVALKPLRNWRRTGSVSSANSWRAMPAPLYTLSKSKVSLAASVTTPEPPVNHMRASESRFAMYTRKSIVSYYDTIVCRTQLQPGSERSFSTNCFFKYHTDFLFQAFRVLQGVYVWSLFTSRAFRQAKSFRSLYVSWQLMTSNQGAWRLTLLTVLCSCEQPGCVSTTCQHLSGCSNPKSLDPHAIEQGDNTPLPKSILMYHVQRGQWKSQGSVCTRAEGPCLCRIAVAEKACRFQRAQCSPHRSSGSRWGAAAESAPPNAP